MIENTQVEKCCPYFKKIFDSLPFPDLKSYYIDDNYKDIFCHDLFFNLNHKLEHERMIDGKNYFIRNP